MATMTASDYAQLMKSHEAAAQPAKKQKKTVGKRPAGHTPIVPKAKPSADGKVKLAPRVRAARKSAKARVPEKWAKFLNDLSYCESEEVCAFLDLCCLFKATARVLLRGLGQQRQ